MLDRFISLPLLALCTFLILTGCEDSEERAERHFQSALALMEEGDFTRATVELRNVIQLNGEHIEGRLLYARILAEQQEPEEALSQYLRVTEQNPNQLEAQIPLTRLALELNAWEIAERHGRKALELAPEDQEVVFLNAVLDYREATQTGGSSDLAGALQIANTTLSVNPTDRLAWRLVIDHAVKSGDSDLALQKIGTAVAHLPDEYELYATRLQILSERNDSTGIGAVLKTMTERFPTDQKIQNLLLAWFREQDDMAGVEAFLRKLAAAPEAGVLEHLRVVDFLQKTKGAEYAKAELDGLIAEAAENRTYLATRAAVDFDLGNTTEAIKTMNELLAVSEDPEETANLRVNLARMLVSSGDTNGAKSLIAEVLSDEEGHVEALKMRSAWLISEDRPEDAILALRTAQAGAPRDPDIMILMAQAHERAGARELAGERYALAVEASGRAPSETLHYTDYLLRTHQVDTAEAVTAEALRLAPFHFGLLTVMADIQIQQQDWDDVEPVLKRLRSETDPAILAAADRIEAVVLRKKHNSQRAIDILSDLTNRDPSNHMATIDLVETLVESDRVDAARDIVSKRLQVEPNNATLRFLRAGLYAIDGQNKKAEAIYLALIREYPQDYQALQQLSNMYVRQKREVDLASLLDATIAAEPEAAFPKQLKAELLERQGDYEGAIALYENLYAKNSGNLVFANNLASLISTYQSDEESISRAYALAQRFRGSNVPAFQDTYGWIVFLRGNPSEALKALESAAKGLPNNPMVQYHLGEALFAVGRIQEAQKSLLTAFELSDGNGRVPEERIIGLLNNSQATE